MEAEKRRMVFSFDVFDTCVTRSFAYPHDLFYDLGLQLAPFLPSKRAKQRFAQRFLRARIRAEKRAHRLVRPSCAVSIRDIYAQLELPEGLSRSVDELVLSEIQLERESIFAIKATVARLGELRDSGHRVIFMSDMYLPCDVLGPILVDCGVMREGEALYVSCDAGVSKRDGRLFRRVLENEGLNPEELTHFGDNLHADVQMARRSGIRAHHVTDGMLTAREIALDGKRWCKNGGRFELAALSRRLRLLAARGGSSTDEMLNAVIHTTIVPFLLAYVIWVLDQAREKGIRRLYFVARDGEIMFCIAQHLVGPRGDVELRYLHGSRGAWLPPSITPSDDTWKRSVVLPGQPDALNTRFDVLARAGVPNHDNEAIRVKFGLTTEEWYLPLPRHGAYNFLNDVLEKQGDLFFRAVRQQRDVTLAYVRQEGLLDSTPWALVDTGWELNGQAALARLLELSGRAHQKPAGYYMGIARESVASRIAGPAYCFVEPRGSIFARRRAVIEHCFTCSTHASTTGYHWHEESVRPTFGLETRTKRELSYAAHLHEEAETAASLIANDKNLLASIRGLTPRIVANAARFLRKPEPSDVQQLAFFGASVDPRHESNLVRRMCEPLSLRDVAAIVWSSISGHSVARANLPVWPEGSAAISPWHTRLPMQVLERGVCTRDKIRQRS